MATFAEIQAEIAARQRIGNPRAMIEHELGLRAAKAAPASTGDIAKDVGASGLAGFGRGLASLADLPAQVEGMGQRAAIALTERLGLVSPEFAQEASQRVASHPLYSGTRTMEALRTVTGGASDYEAKTVPGEYAGTLGEFAPGLLMGGGVGGAARNVIAPALVSETAGQLTKDTALEPYARAAGAIGTPLAAAGLQRIISPFGSVNPERLKMASVLDDFGVPLTAGQRTGSEALRRIEAGATRTARISENQNQAFTRAVLKTIGESADAATPEVMSAAARRIGGVFDDVGSAVNAVPDPASLTKFSEAMQTYRALAPKDTVAPIFGNINKALVSSFRSGDPIPGKQVMTWRSTVSKLTRSPDPATREAAIEAMDALDDIVNQSLTAAGRADDVARLAEARGQWRNLLAVEAAASRAGEGAAAGILSPSQVRNAVVQQGRRAYVQGQRGDIGELSRAAEGVMKPLPTVEAGGVRAVRGMSDLMGAGAGGLAASSVGIDPVIGAIMGAAIPRASKELVSSSAIQKYLANQATSGGNLSGMPAVIPGLLGAVQ